ncbi:PH and SEC7 domain-containing protein 4 [Orycteropus afer afer]|uniref:PH and SEC7 domain-containing protein 4 n=1 Tax=Orycteropus afer afer TaxID=1230840 RepID=A0AC54ZFM4_ORYAF|nr:PH and SEC7 domain-containing protein 4 [Orycteropus afer afer]
MMGDDRLSDHPKSTEFLNICLGENLQPSPGLHPREPSSQPEFPGPCGEQTWAFDSPDSMRQDAARGSETQLMHRESFSSEEAHRQRTTPPRSPRDSHPLGSPRRSQSSSAQVMFWAGILQAQMCVLDLEEELEKTEGLRAELRCCLPVAPTDLSTSPASPRDSGFHPRSSPMEENVGQDSSGPEGKSEGWPRERTPGSSPEWGAEEESLFFDNPLFLKSPCSETYASGEHFSWGFPDTLADGKTGPDSPQTQEPPLPGSGVLWELGSELGLEDDGTTDSSGHTTPPFPVPIYKVHSLSWATGGATDEAPTALPGQVESENSSRDIVGPAPPAASCVDKALAWESGHFGSGLDPATHPVQPWALPCPEGRQTEEGSSSPQIPLSSQDRGHSDAECLQDSATCTLARCSWGTPDSSPEPSSPESESRGPGPWPTPVSSQEGSPQLPRHHSGSIFPKWTLDASHLSLLEKAEVETSSLEKEEARGTSSPEEEVKREDPVSTEEAKAVQLDVDSTFTEGLPESPMPQVQPTEEGQRPQAGDKLANGVRTDKVAWNLASRLYHLEGFRKSEVAAYLQKNNDFSRAVAEEYLSFFQFGGQSLDRALRSFLQALVLSGETQERERILYQFSKRFLHCNPGVFSSVDSVHTLTCAIMLLNTDLHGQNIGKSMSCQEFITNLNGLQDGRNFPKELLKALYWSIRSEKLEWAVDEEDAARPEKTRPSPSAGKTSNPFLQLAQDPTVPIYKQGILARKMHHDADGKKTPWGKRGWKMFHTLLRGMVLYFLKGEEQCPQGESLLGQMVDEPVGVHHSLATPAAHYTKKPHVFQLRTADWRLYLFQAPTAKEMSSWIARINLAAATHSAPPFPAAVGSQRRFVRPILPVGPAQCSLEEQHRSHENCLDAASDDLLDLQRNLPERRGRSRELEEYRLRKEYLEYEKMRYETYVQLLVARLHCPTEDLDPWEEQLGKETGDVQEPKPSLKKSHSSPSLHQDEAPTTAKVKRNISERRTYRKIIPKRNRNQL